jgi:hypothetical protein
MLNGYSLRVKCYELHHFAFKQHKSAVYIKNMHFHGDFLSGMLFTELMWQLAE